MSPGPSVSPRCFSYYEPIRDDQPEYGMRDNPVKKALAEGRHAFGNMAFEFFSPGLPTLCRNAGAEFLLYDMEHTGLGFETLKTQFALCRGLNIVPMARVPRGEYHFIARALDIG